MAMKIHEVAKLAGVTVRTLQYYDKIGLLRPCKKSEADYRLYNEESLETLQQILFFKELDFPLNEIKAIMTSSTYSKQEALKRHKELLLEKKERLENLIHLVDDTLKGVRTMSLKEFDTSSFEAHKAEYAKEAKERWGDSDAYRESKEKTKQYDKEKWALLNQESAAIFEAFAAHKEEAPDGEVARKLVKRWQDYITANYYTCTKEILAGLGMMYVADQRFTDNIDQFGEGTAAFMSAAIAAYCK